MLFISLNRVYSSSYNRNNDDCKQSRVELYIDMDITVSDPKQFTQYNLQNTNKNSILCNTSNQEGCSCAKQIFVHRPLVFSGSICTSLPLISLTDVNAGFPAYSCCGACVEDWLLPPPPSISRDTEMGALPRKRLRMSTRPRLCTNESISLTEMALCERRAGRRGRTCSPKELCSTADIGRGGHLTMAV